MGVAMTYTDDDTECRLIGGVFSICVQIILASVCVSTLIVKRMFEIPQREWTVWFFDFMKQGLGSSFGHITNIIISSHIAHTQGEIDECQWYFVVYVTDSTLGTILNITMLVLAEQAAKNFQSEIAEALKNCGEYGDPPDCRIFSIQLSLWIFIVLISKIVVINFLFFVDTPLNHFVGLAFDRFDGMRHIELLLVMIAVPFVMNILQFWVQDTFLKKDTTLVYSRLPSGDRLINGEQDFDSHLADGDVALSSLKVSSGYNSPVRHH